MDFISLVDYIKFWDFFNKIEWKFEQIISDYDFWDIDWFIYVSKYIDFDKIDFWKKTLFLLDKLIIDNIFDSLLWIENYCIIDMNFGLSWFWKKIWISNISYYDFDNNWICVYEPYDLNSFLSLFDTFDLKKYIRINNSLIPENISDWVSKSVLSLENFWFDWWSFSIVSTWSMISNIIRLWNLFQDEWIDLQLFIINNFDDINVSNFWNRKNLIFVFDWLNFDYQKFVESKLWFSVKFIFPEYKNIDTIIDDYLLESACFDPESLKNKIMM